MLRGMFKPLSGQRPVGTAFFISSLMATCVLLSFLPIPAFSLQLVLFATLILSISLVLRLKQNRLSIDLNYDALTQLPSRRYLEDFLIRALARAKRDQEKLSVLMIDIDRLKVINDTLGHQAGDDLLKEMAERISAVVRQEDLVGRISGDEFAIVAVNVREDDDALFIAKKILSEVAEPFLGQHRLRITASIGVSLYPDDGEDASELIQQASSALEKVKETGKNGVKRYQADHDAHLKRRQRLERDLRHALANDEFSLLYQPLYALDGITLHKFEALIRWRHPILGNISPAEFIPIAEASGEIINIGNWVLSEACAQIALWHKQGHKDFRVAVNVSPIQLTQANFVERVVTILEGHQVEAQRLELEITESQTLGDMDVVRVILEAFQTLGVHLSIDDFGTGYSSFAYLGDLPFSSIKVDRAFVKDITSNTAPAYAMALLQAVVQLAKQLDLEVIAEGIESFPQRDLLKELGCSVGQGYLFSKPLQVTEVNSMFQRDLN